MKLDVAVNNCLKKIKSIDYLKKGSVGEQAVFSICECIYQEIGGILYHSYTYTADKDLAGNIKKGPNGLYLESVGSTTEIDVLLVTPFRIFPIEVKTYKAKSITLTEDGISGCFQDEKSPVHQNEMHCRHLYPQILAALPQGRSEFIVPFVVFVDECTLHDKRSTWQREYIKATVLDRVRYEICQRNTPVDNRYKLDLNLLDNLLKEACTSSERKLPVREII